MLDRRSTPRPLMTAPAVTEQRLVEVAGVLALVGLLLVGAVTRDWWLPSSAPPALSAAAPLDRLAGARATDHSPGTGPDATSVGPSSAAGPSGLPGLCWRFRTGGLIAAAPAVADGVVYAGSWDGHLYALDAAAGTLRWRFPTGNRIDAAVAV